MRARKSPSPPSALAVSDVAVAAARAGVPVEVTQEKKPIPVDGWTRAAQIALAVAAMITFGLFVEFAIGDDGLRGSTAKTTFSSKTGGPAGQAAKTTTTTETRARPRRAGQTDTTTVRTVVVRPRKLRRVAEQSRSSDTITGLMGGIALALALVAATLPRLRSLEFQGLKLGLAGDDPEAEKNAGVAAGKVADAVAKTVPARRVRPVVGDAVVTALVRAPNVVVLEDDADVEEWAQAAVAETLRRTREAKFDAALAGRDLAEAALSEAEIDAIVDRTRPESLS